MGFAFSWRVTVRCESRRFVFVLSSWLPRRRAWSQRVRWKWSMLGDGGRFVTWVGVWTAAGLCAGCLAFQRLLSTMSKHTSEYDFHWEQHNLPLWTLFIKLQSTGLLAVGQKANMLYHSSHVKWVKTHPVQSHFQQRLFVGLIFLRQVLLQRFPLYSSLHSSAPRIMIKGSLSHFYCPFSTPLSRQITSAHLIASLTLSLSLSDAIVTLQLSEKHPHFNF